MRRLGGVVARAFVLALLLLTLAGNVASADPGKNTAAAPVTQTAVLPDDPGYTGGAFFPDDPGFPPQ